ATGHLHPKFLQLFFQPSGVAGLFIWCHPSATARLEPNREKNPAAMEVTDGGNRVARGVRRVGGALAAGGPGRRRHPVAALCRTVARVGAPPPLGSVGPPPGP